MAAVDAVAARSQQRRLVRVWFGEHVIAQQIADPALAGRYEQAMRRRFASLRVTNDAIGSRRPTDA